MPLEARRSRCHWATAQAVPAPGGLAHRLRTQLRPHRAQQRRDQSGGRREHASACARS